MKANVTFVLDAETGKEHARVSILDDEGNLLGELPCITDCTVAYSFNGRTRLTLSMLVDRNLVTLGTPNGGAKND